MPYVLTHNPRNMDFLEHLPTLQSDEIMKEVIASSQLINYK
jgi:hypothetical protein